MMGTWNYEQDCVVRTHLEATNGYTTEKHQSLARERLVELGVGESDIETWLSHIEE